MLKHERILDPGFTDCQSKTYENPPSSPHTARPRKLPTGTQLVGGSRGLMLLSPVWGPLMFPWYLPNFLGTGSACVCRASEGRARVAGQP